MKCGSQIAVAVLGGYALGRSHKTRLAVLLALLAAGGRLPIDQRELLRRTPLGAPLDKLTGELRDQLVDSGMSVVKKAASSRIDSLSDRLQQRAASMRVPVGAEEAEEAEEEEPAPRERRRRAERPARAPRGRERVREEPEYEPEDEYYDEYEDEDEYEEEEPETRRPVRSRPVSSVPGGRAPQGGEPRRGRIRR